MRNTENQKIVPLLSERFVPKGERIPQRPWQKPSDRTPRNRIIGVNAFFVKSDNWAEYVKQEKARKAADALSKESQRLGLYASGASHE